jgi:hypothetical protein
MTATTSVIASATALGIVLALTPGSLAHQLPVGDGKISNNAKRGYVFSCQQNFNANAPGAHAEGPWKTGNTWDPDKKVIVDGSVNWPSQVTIGVEGDKRVVRANNLPKHPTGTFPIARSDDAYQYDRNPNAIAAQNIVLQLPALPVVAAQPSCVPMGMIGFTLSGAAIYNALDAGGRDAPVYEIQDKCNGHPERQGQYHYHDYSDCMSDRRSEAGGHSDLVGYALDGFGIYGKHGTAGKELSNADLDACHGHSHAVTWNGQSREIYHYHYTSEYPYALGCFTGTATSSGQRAGMRPERRSGDQAMVRRDVGGTMAGEGRKPPPRRDGERGLFRLFRP